MSLEKSLALSASAGSGKTFALVVRYLSLLFTDQKINDILALTFTNKASSEMQERIFKTLLDIDKDSRSSELKEIVKVTSLSKEEILSKQKKLIDEFLNVEIKVMTIDKFFALILRKFALNAGIMPSYSTFESQHEIKLQNLFLKNVDVENLSNALVNLALSSSSRFSSIFELLDSIYIKSSEFKNLRYSFKNIEPYELKVMQSMNDIQNFFAPKALSERSKKTLDKNSVEEILAVSWLSKDSFEYWDFKKHYERVVDTYLGELKTSLKEYVEVKEANFFSSLFSLLDIYKKSKKTLAKDENELSFDDVSVMVESLLSSDSIDSEFLYFRLDSNIQHILLDEFQDTSVLQYKVLEPLVDEISAGIGAKENRSFFYVGDIKQSIYRFRGGTSSLFEYVAQNQGVKVRSLNTNYRSYSQIVNFVNQTFLGKISSYENQLSIKDGGYVEVKSSDDILQSTYITIEDLLQNGADINKIAILCWTNKDGKALKEFLSEKGLDVVTETTTKLNNQTKIKAIIEFLKYQYFKEDIYKKNFFALIKQEESSLVRYNLLTNTLSSIAMMCVNSFGFFDDDLDVVKFVDGLYKYKDIDEFIFEYERDSESSLNVNTSGIKIMSVHKSKGLEFESVIVIDRLGRKANNSGVLLFEYDGINLENLFLRVKNRDSFDQRYKEAIDKDKELEKSDLLNALYVALTRPKNNLVVVKNFKNSVFDELDLSDSLQGKMLFEQEKGVKKAHLKDTIEDELYYGSQSDLLSAQPDEEHNLDAIDFGLALHYVLELIESFEEVHIDKAISSAKNNFFHTLNEEDFIDIKRRLLRAFKDDTFKTLVDGKLSKEQGISYKGELRFLDLLVETDDKFIIIDYKSSEAVGEHHLKQVKFYIEALKSLSNKKVEGYLFYFSSNSFKSVRV